MIPYEYLEKHFTASKCISFKHKRIPRKLKKKYKHIQYNFLDLNKKLWYILELENPDYKRFLIKQTIKENGKI